LLLAGGHAVFPAESNGTPERLLERVLADLTRAIDALGRPVDAIKHQAKTVTVGISRETVGARVPTGKLLAAIVDAGADPARVSAPCAANLAALDPAVATTDGVTVYRVTGLDPIGAITQDSRIECVQKTGVAAGLRSRADRSTPLTGTKRKLVSAPRVQTGRGLRDGRSLVMCPLHDRGIVTGLALVHVTFASALATRERARALRASGRYEDLRCLVTEVDVAWDDRLLDAVSVLDLLTEPVERLAERILSA
jgi:glucosamine--fructose-6-phosphate aminotransferase (isomerizing)